LIVECPVATAVRRRASIVQGVAPAPGRERRLRTGVVECSLAATADERRAKIIESSFAATRGRRALVVERPFATAGRKWALVVESTNTTAGRRRRRAEIVQCPNTAAMLWTPRFRRSTVRRQVGGAAPAGRRGGVAVLID